MPNSGSVDSDDAPAPAPRASSPKADKSSGDASAVGDLLNAGLAP
jgi:hypothetical protein